MAKLSCYKIFPICMLLTFTRAHDLKATWRHPHEALDQHSMADTLPRVYQEDFSLTENDLYRIRKIIPKIPFRNTMLDNLYKLSITAKKPINLNFEEVFIKEQEKFTQNLLQDRNLRESHFRGASPSDLEVYASSTDIDANVDIKDIPDDVGDRDQTQGWEGCYLDYNLVMLPVTQDYLYIEALRLNDQLPLPIVDVPEVPPSNAASQRITDNMGKRPPGVLQGALHWTGDVDGCRTIGVRYQLNNTNNETEMETRLFKGKYARLEAPVVELLFDNFTTLWPFAFGICAPDTCSNEEIVRYVTQENNGTMSWLFGFLISRNVTDIYTGQKKDLSNDPPAMGVLALGIILIIMILVATLYDGFGRHRLIRTKIQKCIEEDTKKDVTLDDVLKAQHYLYDSPSFGERLETGFTGFSIYSNLFQIYTTRLPTDHIPCLDGRKGIALVWLVYGMSHIYGIIYFEVWTSWNTITALLRYLGEWTTMPIVGVMYCNSIFFYISGFVCVWMWYKAVRRNGDKVTFWLFIKYFMHRFWTLVPTIFCIVMVYTFSYHYLVEGPLMSHTITDAEKCKSTWWLVLLLWNNLFKLDNQCFAWGWYFANVWQLHIVAIVVLLPLVLLPAVGYLMVALMYVVHLVMYGIWAKRVADKPVLDKPLDWFFNIMQTPWCNAGPFIIGMMFAMIIKGADKKKKWHWFPILLLWILSVGGLLTVVFLPWDEYKESANEWSKEGEIAFETLGPQIIGFSLGWITFACYMGYGGVVGSILNWRLFTVVSKLTFTITIFMGPVMQRYIIERMKPFYIHENHMNHVFYGDIISLLIFGNIFALLLTYPISRGIVTASRAPTRLKIFLWGRHPQFLDTLTGNWEVDEDRLKEMIKKVKAKKRKALKKKREEDKLHRVRAAAYNQAIESKNENDSLPAYNGTTADAQTDE